MEYPAIFKKAFEEKQIVENWVNYSDLFNKNCTAFKHELLDGHNYWAKSMHQSELFVNEP